MSVTETPSISSPDGLRRQGRGGLSLGKEGRQEGGGGQHPPSHAHEEAVGAMALAIDYKVCDDDGPVCGAALANPVLLSAFIRGVELKLLRRLIPGAGCLDD